MVIDGIKARFSIIQDHRQSARVDYPFDVLFAAECAVIAGARGWTDIREYVLGHHDWFFSHRLFE